VDIVWEKKAGLYEEETGREGSYVLRTDRTDLSDRCRFSHYSDKNSHINPDNFPIVTLSID